MDGIWYSPSQFVANAEPDGTADVIKDGHDSVIYKTAGKGDVSIAIPIEGAKTVSVEMRFVELQFMDEESRVFDVIIEDKMVYSEVDLVKRVGHDALWRPKPVIVELEDSTLNIDITSALNGGIISSVLVKAIAPEKDPKPADDPPPANGDKEADIFDIWALLLISSLFFRLIRLKSSIRRKA